MEFLRVLVLVRFSLASILVLYSTSLGPTSPTCTAMPTILRSIFLLNPVPSILKILLSPLSNLASSTIPSQCLLRSAKLPPPASTTSITSGVLESISLWKSVKLLLILLSHLVLIIVTACPSSLLTRLQRVQNSAARLIYNVSRTFSSSHLLINLHWLPVKHRILFKILLITYKAIYYLAPDYIIQLIQVKSSNRTLRSSYYQIFQNSG